MKHDFQDARANVVDQKYDDGKKVEHRDVAKLLIYHIKLYRWKMAVERLEGEVKKRSLQEGLDHFVGQLQGW